MTTFTRPLAKLVYAINAAAFLAAGASALLVNTGVPPGAVRDTVVQFSKGDPGVLHIVQELGAILVLVGLVTLWFVVHYDRSRFFHWALTAYWAIMAVTHWFNVAGPNPSIVGPLVNTVPFAVFLTIGVLREATEASPTAARTELAGSTTSREHPAAPVPAGDTLTA
jgi:hypothetical protein